MNRNKLSLKREKVSQPSCSKITLDLGLPSEKYFTNEDEDDVFMKPVVTGKESQKMEVTENNCTHDLRIPMMDQHNSTIIEDSGSNSNEFQECNQDTNTTTRHCCLCGKVLSATDLDHWKTCLQRFKNRSLDKNSSEETESSDLFSCSICQKNLSHMTEAARNQHMNRCLAKGEDGILQQNESYNCPFCGKILENKNQVAHLKQCGKRNGLDSFNILEILKLLKKQASERHAFGLPNEMFQKVQKKQKKSSTRTTNKIIPASVQEADLQMAIALSSSLQEEKQRIAVLEDENLGIITEPSAFTIIKETQKEIKKKNQKKLENASRLLLLRSENDRLQLVQQRVAAVLCSDCPEIVEGSQRSSSCIDGIASTSTTHSSLIETLKLSSNFLWNLSSKSCEEADDFYVELLHSMVTPSKVKPGTKFCRFSQIPGRLATQTKFQQEETKHDHDGFTQEAVSEVANFLLDEQYSTTCAMNNFSSQINADISNNLLVACNESLIQISNDDIKSSELFPGSYSESHAQKLIDDLNALVGKIDMSDVQFQTKDTVIPGHSFIFYSRCPKLFQAILKEKSENKLQHSPKLDWSNVTTTTALEFLRFIYTGHVSGATISKSQIGFLTEKYDLKTFVEDNNKADNRMLTNVILGENSQWNASNLIDEYDTSGVVSYERQIDLNICEEEKVIKRMSNSFEQLQNSVSGFDLEDVHQKQNSENCTKSNLSHEANGSENTTQNNLNCGSLKNTYAETRCVASDVQQHAKDVLECAEEVVKSGKNLRTPENLFSSKVDNFFSPMPHFNLYSETSTSTPVTHKLTRNSSRHRRFSVSTLRSKSSDSEPKFNSRIAEYTAPETNTSYEMSPVFSSWNYNEISPLSKRCRLSTAVINISSDNDSFVKRDATCNDSNLIAEQSEEKKPQNKDLLQEPETKIESSFNCNNDSINPAAVSPVLIDSPSALEMEDDDHHISNELQSVSNFDMIDISDSLQHENGKHESLCNLGTLKTASIPQEGCFKDNECGDETFLALCERIPEGTVENLPRSLSVCNQRQKATRGITSKPEHLIATEGNHVQLNKHPEFKNVKKLTKKKMLKKSEASPMPDFNALNSPHLQLQLKKIGVRQQKRKQAVTILQHVYYGTHPLLTDSEHETSVDEKSRIPQKEQTRAIKNSEAVAVNVKSALHDLQEDILNSSQSSSFSACSSNSDRHSVLEEECVLSSPEKDSGRRINGNSLLTSNFHLFLTSDPSLHTKVLNYEAIDFEKLHRDISGTGMKHSKKVLMDYLDEQGITFTLNNDRTQGRCKSKKARTKIKSKKS